MYTSMNVGVVKHGHYQFEIPRFAAVSGNLQARRNVRKEVADICFMVLQALGNAFPSSFNTVKLEAFERENEESTSAETIVNNAEGAACIKLGLLPDTDLNGSSASRAEIALAFAHELVLHAVPDLIACSRNIPFETEEAQHRKAYSPANEDNPYHKTMKKIVRYMPADMKKPFLSEYAEDVYEQLYYDTNPGDPMAEAGHAWVAILRENAENPLSSFWRN